MDIERLRAYMFLVEQGSLTEAARELGIDKSSLSRQLSGLEEYFGASLVTRGRRIKPTPAGRELYERAGRIVGELDSLRRGLPADDELNTQWLNIATTHALLSTWLSHLLPEYLEQNPHVRLDIYASNAPIERALQQRDMAIRPKVCSDLDLIQNYLCSWRLQLWASPTYLAKYGRPQKAKDLAEHRLIIFADSGQLYPDSYTHWPLYRGCGIDKARRPFMVVNSVQASAELVRKGVGIGAFAVGSPLFGPLEIEPVLPDELHADVAVHTIYRKSVKNSQRISQLESYLQKKVMESSQLSKDQGVLV